MSGAVEPKSEAQWLREGWNADEISTFSKIGLVLANTGADALTEPQRALIRELVLDLHHSRKRGTIAEVTKFVIAVIEAGDEA
jgi:hypothetical protein